MPDRATERAALMQTSRDWAETVATGNLESALEYWTENAIVLPPDQPAMVGKAAIREFLRQASSIPGFSITWEPEQATVSDEGDMGYLVESNRITFNDASGVLKTQYGKGVTVWRKQADGAWKCVVDTWNNSPEERVLSRVG
jgi:ketosteroid isomerase-like protein